MKKILLAALTAVSLLLAGNNVTGGTGYINSPSAEGMLYQQYSAGIFAHAGTMAQRSHATYFATLGNSRGMELGFIGESEQDGVYLNMKLFRFLDNSDNPLMAAMGFKNIASSGKDGDFPSIYMVTTKKFFNGSSFSFGAQGVYAFETLEMGAILGTEVFLANEFSIVFDLTPVLENKYNLNGGVRYRINPNVFFYGYVLNMIRQDVRAGDLADDVLFLEYPATVVVGISISDFMD